MTRINVVPVETLTDKHLMAEFREITRPFRKVHKRLDSGAGLPTISDKYVLGAGHESFFFNKLHWLLQRYTELYNECANRGFNMNTDLYETVAKDMLKLCRTEQYQGFADYHWKPTPEDMYLNMARLCKRSNLDNVKAEMLSDS